MDEAYYDWVSTERLLSFINIGLKNKQPNNTLLLDDKQNHTHIIHSSDRIFWKTITIRIEYNNSNRIQHDATMENAMKMFDIIIFYKNKCIYNLYKRETMIKCNL